MKSSIRRILSAAALLLIVCLALSSCSLFGGRNKCKHSETELVGAITASCTEEGYTGDTVCKKCEKVIKKGQTVAMLAHSYDSGKTTKNPTCIDEGTTTYTCNSCGKVKTSSIDKVAHQDIYHDAQDGTHNHTCERCTILQNETHVPKDEGVHFDASCEEAAYTLHTCSACEGVYKLYDQGSEPLGHEMGAWVNAKDSTCCETGIKARYCANEGCTYAHEIEIPMASHHVFEFAYYENEPTCIEDGLAIYDCRDCELTEEREAPATGIHAYMSIGESDGYTLKECAHCQNTISSFNADSDFATLDAGTINPDTDLELSMQGSSLQFPESVLSQLGASGELSFGAPQLGESDKASVANGVKNEEIKGHLENAPIFDFGVSANGTSFSENFAEPVLVTIPYDNGDLDQDGIVIYYLAADGTVEEISDTHYDANARELSFFLDHFSFYAVAYRETQEMRCKRGNHDYEKTNQTVTAKCYTFGYTVYECSCCHAKTVDDIVEREPHAYGDVIAASPSCELGDYSTRVCKNEGCGHVLNVQFFGATGHKIDAPATCTTPAKCTKCQGTVVRAFGHDQTEWEVVVEATEEKAGLRRRYCLTCGKMEESKIAMKGAVKPIDFASYPELIDLIFGNLLKMKGGKLTYTATVDGIEQSDTIEVMEKDGTYVLLLTSQNTDGDNTYEIKCYYKDGAVIALETNTDSDGDVYDHAYVTDIDALEDFPFMAMEGMLRTFHATLDEYVKHYLDEAHAILDGHGDAITTKMNEIFAEAGLSYTAGSLEELLDSIENFYAYLSLRLGYDTLAELDDTVTIPTPEDALAILEVFTTVTEKDGVKTYAFGIDPIMEAISALVDWLDTRAEKTLAEVLYELFGESLKESDATLTDFDAVMARLTTEFPGNLKVSDAVDKFITVFEENGVITLDMLYRVLDLAGSYFLPSNSGNGFSTEALVAQYGNVTLNELVRMALGSPDVTIEQLYAFASDYCKNTKLAETAIPMAERFDMPSMTVGEVVMMAKAYLANATVRDDISFSLDAEGRLVALKCDQDISIVMQEGEEPVSLQSVHATFTHDAAYQVKLPEIFKGLDYNTKESYDKDGNLVIEGLDPSVDFDVTINGNVQVSLSELLKEDKELSEALGFKVYKTDKKYWTDDDSKDVLYFVNGKYYTDYTYVDGLGEGGTAKDVQKALDVSALVADPMALLPKPDSAHDGYAGGSSNESFPAWNFILGIVYYNESYGDWMICTDYSESTNNGEIFYRLWDDGEPYASFFAEGFRLSSLEGDNDTARYQGKEYPLYRAYFGADSYNTRGVSCILVNDKLVAVSLARKDEQKAMSFYGEVSFPAEGTYDEYETETESGKIIDANGNVVNAEFSYYRFYTYKPSYYIKVTDGSYAEIGDYIDTDKNGATVFDGDFIRTGFYTAAFESVSLPDGNTLYVLGRDSNDGYCQQNGYEAHYGYAKTADGVFLQAIAYMKDGKVAEHIYRYAKETLTVDADHIFDVSANLTKKDGKYVIASSLIAELKKLCKGINDYFSFTLSGEKKVGELDFNIDYTFGLYVNEPAYNVNAFFGGGVSSHEDPFYRYFSNGQPGEYKLALDEKGNLVIYYEDGSLITDLNFNFNDAFPADEILKKNNTMSAQTGLEIYSYYTESHYSRTLGSYVYLNGKYYQYNTPDTYLVAYTDAQSFKSNLLIDDMRYRFDIVLAEGIQSVPVFETELTFGRSFNSTYRMTVYTFLMDGTLYVAKQGYTTGNSLLTFESYEPFSEYISSLEIVFRTGDESYSSTYYHESKKLTVYEGTVEIYETDGRGNRLYTEGNEGEPYTTIDVHYVKENGKTKIVCDADYVGDFLELGAQLTSFEFDKAACEESLSTHTFYNRTVDIVTYTQVGTDTTAYNFIKLAGKYYDYSRTTLSYLDKRITDSEFTQSSRDLVWYYMVVDHETDERSYYTEFIPSDYGFAPAGDTVDPSAFNGSYENQTLLGYTAEGDELYEVAFYVESSAGESWKTVSQSDGTVFYHVNGKGYLRDQKGYYVPARQVTKTDGTTEIVCMLHGSFVHDDYLNDRNEVLAKYLSIEDGGARLILTPELLEFAKHHRSHFRFSYTAERGWSSVNQGIDYDLLESLFLVAGEQ